MKRNNIPTKSPSDAHLTNDPKMLRMFLMYVSLRRFRETLHLLVMIDKFQSTFDYSNLSVRRSDQCFNLTQ